MTSRDGSFARKKSAVVGIPSEFEALYDCTLRCAQTEADPVMGEEELFRVVFYLRKVFAVHISDHDSKCFLSQYGAVNWLEQRVSGQPLSRYAAQRLNRVWNLRGRPESNSNNDKWNRGRIAAVVGDLFHRLAVTQSHPEISDCVWRDYSRLEPHRRKISWRDLLSGKFTAFVFWLVLLMILVYRQTFR